MEYFSQILIVAAAYTLVAVTPGPNFFIVIKNSVSYSRRIGMCTAFGVTMATISHMTFSLLGLAVIVSQIVWLFNSLKLICGGYLIYIGVKMLFTKKLEAAANETGQPQHLTVFQAIKSGFLTNLFNPKAVLFFLSLFTVITSPDALISQKIAMALVIALISFIWYLNVAIFFSQVWLQKRYEKFGHWMNRVFGAVLITFGGMIIRTGKQ